MYTFYDLERCDNEIVFRWTKSLFQIAIASINYRSDNNYIFMNSHKIESQQTEVDAMIVKRIYL